MEQGKKKADEITPSSRPEDSRAAQLKGEVRLYYQPQGETSIMENTRMIYKPHALTIKRKGDPEQLARDWEKYIKAFLGVVKIIKDHNSPEIAGTPCAGCRNAKDLLILVGGTELKMLFIHIWSSRSR